jgi:hypothetical protein
VSGIAGPRFALGPFGAGVVPVFFVASFTGASDSGSGASDSLFPCQSPYQGAGFIGEGRSW